MAGLIKKLKEQLECAICTEYDEKETKALICLHSFCKGCIVTVAKGEKSISCPICRKVTNFPEGKVDGLLNDYTKSQINDMIRGYEVEPDDKDLPVAQEKPAVEKPVMQKVIPPVESEEEAKAIKRAIEMSLEDRQPRKSPKRESSLVYERELAFEDLVTQEEIEEEELEQYYVKRLGEHIKAFRKDSKSIKLTLNTAVADMPRSTIDVLARYLDYQERWRMLAPLLGFT